MGGHGHRRGPRWPERDVRESGFPRQGEGHVGAPPRRPRPVFWLLALAALLAWSLVAWIAYGLADGVLGWLADGSGAAVEAGRGIAGAAGVGREVGAAIDGANLGGLLGQGFTLLRAIAKPAIVLIWLLGGIVILAAPLVVPRILRGHSGGRWRH